MPSFLGNVGGGPQGGLGKLGELWGSQGKPVEPWLNLGKLGEHWGALGKPGNPGEAKEAWGSIGKP